MGSDSSIPLSDGYDLASQISKNTSFHGSDLGTSANPERDLLRNLLSHTLTFQKMLDYYKNNKGVDIIKEKLSNSIAQKMGEQLKLCPLCQRPYKSKKLKSGIELNENQNWILPQHITQFALKEQ